MVSIQEDDDIIVLDVFTISENSAFRNRHLKIVLIIGRLILIFDYF